MKASSDRSSLRFWSTSWVFFRLRTFESNNPDSHVHVTSKFLSQFANRAKFWSTLYWIYYHICSYSRLLRCLGSTQLSSSRWIEPLTIQKELLIICNNFHHRFNSTSIWLGSHKFGSCRGKIVLYYTYKILLFYIIELFRESSWKVFERFLFI